MDTYAPEMPYSSSAVLFSGVFGMSLPASSGRLSFLPLSPSPFGFWRSEFFAAAAGTRQARELLLNLTE